MGNHAPQAAEDLGSPLAIPRPGNGIRLPLLSYLRVQKQAVQGLKRDTDGSQPPGLSAHGNKSKLAVGRGRP